MVDVLLGLQWGDEGKGKIADFLTTQYDVVARFQGGPNAGHSLEMNGKKHVLNTIPSGIFHENCINVIGNGVVLDPILLKKEIEKTIAAGADVKKNLYISKKAHLILPTHRLLDAASEAAKGDSKIGSTLRGISPTYQDKTGRRGLRVGDIETNDFRERYNDVVERHKSLMNFYDFYFQHQLEELEEEFWVAIDYLKEFKHCESEYFINEAMNSGKKILAEGAQGSMLDLDFGSYPFVTSSNTISAGACVGMGFAPTKVGKVRGIFKAYCTRVGGGPFPTELNDDDGQALRDKGHEYGATTGRPRRCGWLDLPALKYAIMLSGVDEAIMMKADVLSGFDTIKVCIGYEIDGKVTTEVPFDVCNATITPVYKDFKGWEEDISGCKAMSELPQTFIDYINWIEKEINIPIGIISIGPDRDQTINRKLTQTV